MDKNIYLYSNPNVVLEKAKRLLGNDVELFISDKPKKKYAICGKFSKGKLIHFGFYGMEDATKHNDEKRINAFRSRNAKWKNSKKDSASYLSYYLLW